MCVCILTVWGGRLIDKEYMERVEDNTYVYLA